MHITSSQKPIFLFTKDYPTQNQCTIAFPTNIVDNGDGTWTYDQYTITEPWKINLQAQIEAYYADWLQKAKDLEFQTESEKVRSFRDALLSEADTLYCNVENWDLMDAESRSAWQDYKQTLRDISKQTGFPFTIVWPKKPPLQIDRGKATETEALQAENKLLRGQLKAATDRNDFIEDCVAELVTYLYV